MPIELLLIKILKALAEIAGMFLLGQGVLYLLAGPKRETNFMYSLFQLLTRPIMRIARAITPRLVVDRHIPFVALLIVFWLWVIATMLLIQYCAGDNMALCNP